MVIAIFMVTIGLVFLGGLPSEQYPDITPPVVSVRATYTGADALSVEQSVATPLEQQINGVDNMLYMKSTNASDGTMSIDISFDVGTDPDMNTVFAQNRVAAATAALPEEVKRQGVVTQKSMPNVLMLIALTSDDPRFDHQSLGNYALINIQDILSRIKGVGRVNVMGSSDYSMRIWVKPDRLAQLGISIPEITEAIRAQSVIVPGGKLGAEPAPPGTEFTYSVRLPERLQSEKEFGEIVIRTAENGSQVKIKQVARVELGVESYSAFSRLDDKPCAMIALYQAPGSNAVALAEEVRQTMAELEQDFPNGMRYDISLDTTLAVSAGISEIIETLFIALALVILVVFAFIQDWRATLIPTVAIPVSLLAAFIAFPAIGFSINVLSLLGLVLAIGIVVDDAIVVVEAVQVKIDEGMSPKEATRSAMREVTAPVIATTLVMVAIFIPVAVMEGITGRLYQQFAITVAVSVVFSSVNALTLGPALSSLLLRKQTPGHGPLALLFKLFNAFLEKTTAGYTALTRKVTRNIAGGVLFLLGCVGAIGLLSTLVPGGFMPVEDTGYLMVNIQLPDAASMQRTDAVMKKIEDIVQGHEEVEHVTSVIGFSLLSSSTSPNTGFIFVSLKPWDARETTAKELVNTLNKQFFMAINEAQVFAFGPPAIPGLGSGSGFTMLLQDRRGNTPEYLAEESARFIARANARPEIGSVVTTFRPSVPQRYMDINIDKVLKANVAINDIYTTVGAFLGGAYVNDFNRFGRLYRVYVQSEAEYRLSEDRINLFFVRNSEGESVPLSSFVTIHETAGPAYTNRFNLYRSVELTGGPAPGYTSAQALDALEAVAKESLPDGMGYAWSNMSYQEKKASGTAGVVFAFSLFFVYLILAAQYESWSLPLSILLGTPFAVLGALLALFMARLTSPSYELNIFAQIALVMLIGMAAKNAILIVEFANLEFKRGLSLYDAAIKAASRRFRPILMTAFSFILGVLPLVVATGAGAEARTVMGMTLLGGMVLATVLGVLFYPMLFVLVGKLAKYEEKRDRAKVAPSKNPEDV
jgi:HAE1 family hydrophobic/amphiphilic exporter-1